jgi:RNA polymerase primary sigma factor
MDSADLHEAGHQVRAAEGGPGSSDRRPDAFDHYVRDIGPLPLLTLEQERSFGREVQRADRRWRRAVLANPATALAVLEHWAALRAAGRRGTRMVESSAEPDERRIVRAMARVARLCKARAAVRTGDAAERDRLDSSIRRLLYRLDLSVRLLEQIEGDLQAHPARAARMTGAPPRIMRRMLQESRDAHERLSEAKQRFVCANVKLVIHIAKGYRNRGLPLSDVIQEGNLGLLRAVEKFDPDRGVRFSSYAAYWIRQAIQRGIQCKARMIRVPSLLQQQVQRIGRDDAKRRSHGEAESSFEEQARSLRMEPSEALGLLASLREPVSIDAPVYDDSEPLVDTLSDPDSEQIEDMLETRNLGGLLQSMIRKLEPRERLVVERRFGLARRLPETLESIGRDLELSRERIRQIEKKALERLRELMSQQLPDGASIEEGGSR